MNADVRAMSSPPRPAVHAEKLGTVHAHRPADNLRRARQDVEDRLADHRLAGAALADQSAHLARSDTSG